MMTKTTLLTTIVLAMLMAFAGNSFGAEGEGPPLILLAQTEGAAAETAAQRTAALRSGTLGEDEEATAADQAVVQEGDEDEEDLQPFEETFRYLKAKYGTETMTDDWFGFGTKLQDEGILISLAHTQIYQINLQGGLATHRHSGRWTGNYDLYTELDLEKILGLRDGLIYMLVEGSWSAGLDPSSIGSVVGNVNANAFREDEVIYVSEFWYEQGFFDNRYRFRVGKMDLTSGYECHNCSVAFDQNAYAFDETSQFMNAAFVNNPTIPFPENGLGVSAYAEPIERFFVAAAVVDAQADVREMGTNTAFHDEDYFFAIFETGIAPVVDSPNGKMPGAYRVGFWYDPQDKPKLNGQGVKRDDVGFYLSFDQLVFKENVYAKDSQGLGMFARYGFAHSDVNAIKAFYSIGAQYQGLIPRRDYDVLGLGYAVGKLDSDSGTNKDHESIIELYYNAQITPWLNLSPSLQYIFDPGAVHGVSDALVVGIRMQVFF